MATENPHSNPQAARLAVKLVEEQFGEICRKLVEALVGHGVQTFPDLLRTSKLPPNQLKTALLILIQHSCVRCYFQQEPPTLRGPGPSYQLYEAAMDRILQILRAPRFLTHVHDEMGDLAEVVVQKVLEHGRLRVEQLIQAVQSEHAEGGEPGGEGDDDAPSATELHTVFVSLVKARYVERVPPCTLPPPPKQLHPAARKKKPSLKTTAEEEESTQRQQANALLHLAYQQARFQLPTDLAEGMGLDAAAAAVATEGSPGAEGGRGDAGGAAEATEGKSGKKGASGKGKRKTAAAADVDVEELPAPKKRGRKKVKADQEMPAPAAAPGAPGGSTGGGGAASGSIEGGAGASAELAASEVLWRVNYEEFNRRFRNEEVVRFVQEKHGKEAAAVAAAMLAANARFELEVRIDSTSILPEADIAGAARRLDPQEYAVPQSVVEVLRELERDDLGIVTFAGHGPGGAQYTLHVSAVLQLVRLMQLQAVIRDRFGPSGMRIWRALLLHKQLEQKQVADFGMLPKEQARQLLYGMVKAGFLSIQDVPRTADHAPSRTFYTFRAAYDQAAARVCSDLYRSAANVHARLAHEAQKHAEVFELVDLVSSGQAPRSVLSARAEELMQVRRVTSVLESSLMHLDHMVALFNDM